MDVMTLTEFWAKVPPRTLEDKLLTLEQAIWLLDEHFVHMPLKIPVDNLDPVQALRHLQKKLPFVESQSDIDFDIHFYERLLRIFVALRDQHTGYLLPEPFRSHIAFLPFEVSTYYDDDRTIHFVVARITIDFNHRTFQPGVNVTYWNGMPIRLRVRREAERLSGVGSEARTARAITNLTYRPLRSYLPPDEDWVIVGYTDNDGRDCEIRLEWHVKSVKDWTQSGLGSSMQVAIEPQAFLGEVLFTPTAYGEKRQSEHFEARHVITSSGEFGYVRIRHFATEEPDLFVEEFVELISDLTQTGLVLDIRRNPGGDITASECLLQLLTSKVIEPTRAQFRATPSNYELCIMYNSLSKRRSDVDLGMQHFDLGAALQRDAQYGAAFPITEPERANAIGQVYRGPVVLITDTRSYSAADVFAAGFVDHEIGPILSLGGTTGAGGANVWTHGLLCDLAEEGKYGQFYHRLTDGEDFSISVRRIIRKHGTPIEDLGVTADSAHYLTRSDILNYDADLLEDAGELLSKLS